MSCLTIQLHLFQFRGNRYRDLFAGYTVYACVTLFWRSWKTRLSTLGTHTRLRFLFPFRPPAAALQLLDQLSFLRLRDDRG